MSFLFSAPKIPLNERCDQRDACRDNFASCDPFESKCLCKDGYYERNRQCGKLSNKSYESMIKLLLLYYILF